ncbi:MAG: ATPase, partial [Ruminiclostridium sp.]|nr:ATPase [Ruminiclostridium sp.]
MAIEKMALVRIEGALKRVNKTLIKCCESNCFHVIISSKSVDNGKGFRALKSKSPFAPIMNRARALADGLGITIKKVDYDDVNMNVTVDFDNYYKDIEGRFNDLFERKLKIREELKDHSSSLMQVEKLSGLDSDFAEIFACKYVKLRFGRLPVDSVLKLDYYDDKNFICYHFKEEDGYSQILYVTPVTDAVEVDDIFDSLFFERIHLPDYVHGDADHAKTDLLKMVKDENAQLDAVNKEIEALRASVENDFLKVTSKLAAIDQSYNLRQNVAAVNNKFFMSGYVPKRKLKEFTRAVESVGDVKVTERPLDSEPNSSPPVLLRNNWLFRPFEMFIKMYGLPNYKCFDPTPYVAVTYMLIFGIMFGDLGQGLLITILGIILDKWKHVKLAPIMQRIGITSAVFGTLYGSVFGNEEIIEPFFKIPSIYKALGYDSAPKDIFQISTILLITAIGIGAVLVVISIMMNIVTNIKGPNWLADAVLGPNGIVGLVFYVSAVVGAAFTLGLGINLFSAPYVICLIVLPLVLMFLKEPIGDLLNKVIKPKAKENTSNILHAVKTYSNAVSDLGSVNEISLDRIIESGFFKAQYGSISLSSYNKIENSVKGDYVFYPLESDGNSVNGVYIASVKDMPNTDKSFEALGFKKMKMPEHIEDIRKEQALHLSDYMAEVKKEHKSIGNIIIEGVIELFEGVLCYLTNTMSFLR